MKFDLDERGSTPPTRKSVAIKTLTGHPPDDSLPLLFLGIDFNPYPWENLL
jgi:hypothetical protein